ncbi:MAG: hypothetical protein A2622_13400 [Bdellovibrionales bacterium RIFCSPHIGHO2_01_FULL_40_29]|nr:MAG: hypothetical protein A2622_13400 [Bdellovibrionales bacterium RIFCSPHIGHO2_01_FULL_40_29]OFZ34308.1 MAG: hypothetical protein A3D17_04550 [Bdellovibrionales bacterium RIFCSPHIGHO2_02_FULL_40_15]
MGLKISRILHAGYIFECGQTQIACDPIFENPFSVNCHAYPNVQFNHAEISKLRLDAVFISHFHDDHCSFESLKHLHRETPIYIYCLFKEMMSWIRELGFSKVYSLDLNLSISIGDIQIIPRRALDSDVDCLFQLQCCGLNVLNVVDSWIDEATLTLLHQQGDWDLILWPFQTMREIEVIMPSRSMPASGEIPIEWIEQLKILNPRYIVPSSCQFIHEEWSWYRHAFFPISYQQFQQQIELALPDSKVIRLNPSVAIELDQNSIQFAKPLHWVQPLGDHDVDYEYKKDFKAPATSQISIHFKELTWKQREFVIEFCCKGIVEKFNSLDRSDEIYFSITRHWKLSVFDSSGNAMDFHYAVSPQEMQFLGKSSNEPISWLTEIPLAKLYGALADGETLSSLYLRINDFIFSTEIELEMHDLDCLEDPLMRCLFNGEFGTYQLAQLTRLRLKSSQ